jgi:p-aminobenzoyl-glutamate transporter AbgT
MFQENVRIVTPATAPLCLAGEAGVGMVFALMLPYVDWMLVLWTLFFVVWYLLGILWGL